ncbi:MAG: hypothetical protein J7M03_06190 [Candidatus Desulfofervidaceae bacterium]|nr:hypothetical protein [Candidatus Desulfofervidaceae bacterium]
MTNVKPSFSPFPVQITTSLLTFHLTPAAFVVQGKMLFSLFGGKVWVENLKIERPFSPAAKIKADVNFEDIDLAKLSQHLSFGKIKGLVKGHVRNLVIAYGQPESFDLVIENVKKKRSGKKQRLLEPGYKLKKGNG